MVLDEAARAGKSSIDLDVIAALKRGPLCPNIFC
jgi:hypothetical protein